MLNGEATYINIIIYGLTRPRLELMIYHTQDKHVNHYTTDDVVYITYTTDDVVYITWQSVCIPLSIDYPLHHWWCGLYHLTICLYSSINRLPITPLMQGSRWASPMSPFAIFNFIWWQNTALGDFFGDNILFITIYFILLSINGAGKKHRLLEHASWWQIIKTSNKSITSDC